MILDDHNNSLFVAKDIIADMWGYSDSAKAVRTHCKGVAEMSTPSAGNLKMTKIILRSDLLRLVAKSKLPAAEAFEDLVYGEVIPSVRITSMFATNSVFIPNVN